MKRSSVVVAILCAALAVMLSSGIRSSFGLFLSPISAELGMGREAFSLALALNTIIYGVPLVGILADRIGPRWVIVAGGLLYVIGLFAMTRVTQLGGLIATMGVLVGLALSATTYVVVLGAVAQIVPAERRSQSFGIITAAGSSGGIIVPPLAQFLLSAFGWRMALMLLSIFAALIIGLAFGLPSSPGRQDAAKDSGEPDEPFIAILRRASRHSGYLLLTAGFFVCGFHVSFIGAHLPAFLGDNGLSGEIGAAALSIIGVFNLVGSYLFGWLGDRYRKKYLLSFIYFGRAVVFSLFVLLPMTQMTALTLSAASGFLWLATVPLTSGTVAQIFGVRYLSTLYGMVFLSHQVGGFLGVWLGGRIYDTVGNYDFVWYAAIALGLFATLIHAPISDEPVGNLQPA